MADNVDDEFSSLTVVEQLEMMWSLVTRLGPLATMMEEIQDTVRKTGSKITSLEECKRKGKKTPKPSLGSVLPPINTTHGADLLTRRSPSLAQYQVPITILRYRQLHRTVVLNVGGEKHEVAWKTLEQMPSTRLGRLASASSHQDIMHCADYYSLTDNEFFFDRHPRSFKAILDYFRTGRLHVVDEMCIIAFSDDLQYWGISELWLETCCMNKYMVRKEYVEEEMVKEIQNLRKESSEFWGEGLCARSQKFLWDLFEKPESSLGALVVSYASVLFVVVSTVAMVINTLPSLAGPPDENGNPTDNAVLSMLETICITWFTLEYILRFAGAPRKCQFLKDAMNIVDVLAILPFFISLAVLESTPEGEDQEEFNDIRKIVSVFRIMRIMRIFKLARHSTGLQSIAYTLKNSYKELALLVLFMSMGVLVFSSLCFFAEKDEKDTKFVSIPATFWWAVITMTTVGYGDIYPTTGVGKIIGALAAVSGALVMALPIPIVVNNFAAFYMETKKREKSIKRHQEKEARDAEEAMLAKASVAAESNLAV